jgi:MoxR-like ATPase
VDGVTYPLPHPFMVIATQNPIEYEGTFPLPEAQLDRFMLQIRLGYPSFKDEVLVLENQQLRHPIEDLQSVVSTEEVITNQEEVKKVFVSKAVKQYIVEICRATRNHSDVHLGASPRGSLALFKLGQAHAALEGRDFVLPDDVQVVAPFALPHRLMLQAAARLRNLAATQVVEEILKTIPVPGHDLEPEK